MKNEDLPKSWCKTSIVKLLVENSNGKPFQQGWSPQCKNHPAEDDSWGVLKTTAIQDGEFWSHENKMLPETIKPRPHLEVSQGDILMTCAGPRNRCGVVCFVKKTRSKLLMSGKMYRFRADEKLIYPKYLEAFIRSLDAKKAIDSMKTGISDSGLNLTHDRFSELEIPLAPLNEQKRIIEKIETLFSELDNGIASLKTAQEQLKVYRQSVLKHAFEGKLTEQWREENADKLESPEQLLARIQQEREARYQEQLSEWETAVKAWEENGKEGKKPSKLKPLKALLPITEEEKSSLPDLPTSYTYTHLSNVGDLGRGKSKHRPRNDPRLFGGKYPFIQTGEVKASNRYIKNYNQTYTDFGLKQSKLWPSGTLCITIAANIAETAFLDFDCCFPDSVVGFTAYKSILPEYVELFIKAVRIKIEAYAPATAQKNINLSTLENLIIPYCSLVEQKKLITQLETIFSAIDENENQIIETLIRSETLRQSILKKAFSGQLVPQDPNDEPANELLERIQAEKEAIKQAELAAKKLLAEEKKKAKAAVSKKVKDASQKTKAAETN